MYHVDFLNKNTFRNYPLRGDIPVVDTAGNPLPTAFFSSAQFSVLAEHTRVFFSRVYVSGDYVNILVAGKVGNTVTYLGFFDGKITGDHQQLKLRPIIPTCFGSITIGRLEALAAFEGFHNFTEDTGRVEDSLVTFMVPPALKSITVHGTRLTGRIGLEYSNVKRVTDPSDILLEVINKEQVRALNDTGSAFACPTRPIGTMNGVTPDVAGNIDIYGIAPVSVQVTAEGLIFDVPGLTKAKLCTEEQRIPPLVATSAYLQDIRTATNPEWKSWPQYN